MLDYSLKPCPDCGCKEIDSFSIVITDYDTKDKTGEHHIMCTKCSKSVKASTLAEAEQLWEELKKDPLRHARELGEAAYEAGMKQLAIADEKLSLLIAENEGLAVRLTGAWHCGFTWAANSAAVKKELGGKKNETS